MRRGKERKKNGRKSEKKRAKIEERGKKGMGTREREREGKKIQKKKAQQKQLFVLVPGTKFSDFVK